MTCWFHKWRKWEILEEGALLCRDTDAVVGKYFIQQRHCSRCGKTQWSGQKSE